MPTFVVLSSVVLSSDVLMSVVIPSSAVMTGLVELASVVGEGSSTKMIKTNAIENYRFQSDIGYLYRSDIMYMSYVSYDVSFNVSELKRHNQIQFYTCLKW